MSWSEPHRVDIRGLRHTFGSQMAMAGTDPFAIMKAMGHTDMNTTMLYVSLGKSHIQEQVEKLNGIKVPPPPAKKGNVVLFRRSHPDGLESVMTR
jgi:integrase